MTVHGVLWVLDEIHGNNLAAAVEILAALRLFAADVTVRLPRRALLDLIKRYERDS